LPSYPCRRLPHDFTVLPYPSYCRYFLFVGDMWTRHFSGVGWVHLARRPQFGLLYHLRMMSVEQGKPKCSGKPAPVPHCSPQVPHDLGSDPDRHHGKPSTNRLSCGTAQGESLITYDELQSLRGEWPWAEWHGSCFWGLMRIRYKEQKGIATWRLKAAILEWEQTSIPRQRLGKHIPAATNTQTIELPFLYGGEVNTPL
jgi:hypothetical protein